MFHNFKALLLYLIREPSVSFSSVMCFNRWLCQHYAAIKIMAVL